MKDLSLDERREILLDLKVMKPKEVQEKYHITNGTIQHIKFTHGKSSAVAGGYYHKDLLKDAENPIVSSIKELKAKGMNSLQVANELHLDLAVVNKNW